MDRNEKKILIHFVTNNPGKFEDASREIRKFADGKIELVQLRMELEELQIEEQEEVARAKAENAWRRAGMPLIIDDTGVYFERYHRFPGFITKQLFYAIGYDGLKRLYDEGDRAAFRTWIVFRNAEHREVFLGEVWGKLTKNLWFPPNSEMKYLAYSALFVPDGSNGKTLAQIRWEGGLEEYIRFSSRAVAIKKFCDWAVEKPPKI